MVLSTNDPSRGPGGRSHAATRLLTSRTLCIRLTRPTWTRLAPTPPTRSTQSKPHRWCRSVRCSRGAEFAGEELRASAPERPVVVAVLGDGDDEVVALEPAFPVQAFGEQSIQQLLLSACA